MSGCLAAIRYPKARIIEQALVPKVNHHALLRFGTKGTQDLTGIELEKVIVGKYIYSQSANVCHQSPTPKDIVDYSRKTNGAVSRRSIANLESAVRYIPPQDFHQQLLDRLEDRIDVGQKIHSIRNGEITTDTGSTFETDEPIISTLPMAVNLQATGTIHHIDFSIRSRPIYVTKMVLDSYSINMTVYFPQPKLNVYRASMIGSILAVESVAPLCQEDIDSVLAALSIREKDITSILLGDKKQDNGKIQPIPGDTRKTLLHEMTQKNNVYSLGRFACWRQILLDDVIVDIEKIDRMITTHPYDRSL